MKKTSLIIILTLITSFNLLAATNEEKLQSYLQKYVLNLFPNSPICEWYINPIGPKIGICTTNIQPYLHVSSKIIIKFGAGRYRVSEVPFLNAPLEITLPTQEKLDILYP